jgi:hypothetical protein
MLAGRLVFTQLMDFLPKYEFRKCVKRYKGDYRVKDFTCYNQYLAMAFAQLTFREGLRDIQACLRAVQSKLYYMGFRSPIAKSTLADANESRDWRIYADFAQVLISKARKLYGSDEIGIELDNTVYALDSTTIDLCLSLFPWARFRTTKAAVKLHALLDLRGSIPTFIHVSDGKFADVNVLDLLLPEAGSFYIMDRAYTDFERLYALHQAQAFFVTRAKKNFQFKRRYSHPVDKTTGLLCDQTIMLKGFYPSKDYPDPMRRIRYFDAETENRLIFLTNNFELPALTITQLYKARWKIELFFKWIKQHLRIKKFFGTSENAVKTQIWIAVSVYVLVAIVKKKLFLEKSLYEILQILSVTLFEKTPLLDVFSDTCYTFKEHDNDNSLTLFDL